MDYLTLSVVALAGYAGAPAWAIAAATIALASLSYAKHHLLYRRGADLGLSDQMDATMLSSVFNAFAASPAFSHELSASRARIRQSCFATTT